MALQWEWKRKMGTITFKTKNGEKYTVNIYAGNCLAILLHEYKVDGKEYYNLYGFFQDARHCHRIIKDNGNLLGSDKIINIQLNLFYKNAETLLNILVKNGYKVKVYYDEQS